jgi:dolichol-phosphate mannosyltransferase
MKYADFTVVIPTLNEEKTIGPLINEIVSSYPGIRIMVMDDGSADNTGSVVKRIGGRNRNVIFHDRGGSNTRKGLTYSMIDGIAEAKTRYVIFMDGDLQHPPRTIKTISRRLEGGAQIVIAARAKTYNTIFYRHMISWACTTAGYAILFLRNRSRSQDLFSGYFGIDRVYVMNVVRHNRNRFVGGGYKFLFDLLKCIDYGKARITEVPYRLRRRRYGKSKATIMHGIALMKSFVT